MSPVGGFLHSDLCRRRKNCSIDIICILNGICTRARIVVNIEYVQSVICEDALHAMIRLEYR